MTAAASSHNRGPCRAYQDAFRKDQWFSQVLSISSPCIKYVSGRSEYQTLVGIMARQGRALVREEEL
eukprot:scaffold48664_cov50-Prasinocladus_malaysianus.AAC.1